MASEKEIILNKQHRGQIMRVASMFYPTPVSIRQIKISLAEYGITVTADTDKHLYYLADKGYIRQDDKDEGGLVYITSKGIDLVEGTIEDEGLYL